MTNRRRAWGALMSRARSFVVNGQLRSVLGGGAGAGSPDRLAIIFDGQDLDKVLSDLNA